MENRHTKCILPANIDKCIGDAMLLMNDYAGKVSETTAIMLYMYQHYTLYFLYPETADIIEGIALTEMAHHELLGKAIVKLGGDPIIGADYRFWNGSYVNYTRELKKILVVDIEAEEQAIFNYKRTIENLESDNIKEMIKCIISEEQEHLKIFNDLLNMVNRAT